MRSRRTFLGDTAGCAAWLSAAAMLPGSPARSFARQARGEVVLEAPFARVERIVDGVFAIVSTPLHDGERDFTTGANGGIVAGNDGVLLIEAFYGPEGADWALQACRTLTGRQPDRVALTHYHADHARGLARIEEVVPAHRALMTRTTSALLERDDADAAGIAEDAPTLIDLGGRTVRLTPRDGHTRSDVSIDLQDPPVVWCGDLVWNGLFPNYVDAIPSRLTPHCEALLNDQEAIFVPGHGDPGDASSLASYLDLLREVEAGARRAFERGVPAEEAAAAERLPESLGTWTMFSPDYLARAFRAWERELAGGRSSPAEPAHRAAGLRDAPGGASIHRRQAHDSTDRQVTP